MKNRIETCLEKCFPCTRLFRKTCGMLALLTLSGGWFEKTFPTTVQSKIAETENQFSLSRQQRQQRQPKSLEFRCGLQARLQSNNKSNPRFSPHLQEPLVKNGVITGFGKEELFKEGSLYGVINQRARSSLLQKSQPGGVCERRFQETQVWSLVKSSSSTTIIDTKPRTTDATTRQRSSGRRHYTRGEQAQRWNKTSRVGSASLRKFS